MNIFSESELKREATIRKFRMVHYESELVRNSVVAEYATTTAEIVHDRVDANKRNMGLMSWEGSRPTKSDAAIAKNYLNPEELDTLNRIVNAYLEFAELQALNRKPMYMSDWAAKLDDFLRLGGRDTLKHEGTVSNEAAVRKAEIEYKEYRNKMLAEPSQAEKDFEEAIKKLPKPDGKLGEFNSDGQDEGKEV